MAKLTDEQKAEKLFTGKVSTPVEILNNLRLDMEGEYLAIRGYDERADFAEKNGYGDIAKVLRDIRDEEKVHVGELQALMDKYDKEYKESVKDGKKEATDSED